MDEDGNWLSLDIRFLDYISPDELECAQWGLVNIDSSLDNSGINIPSDISIDNIYPNPFNPTTTIRYDLPEDSNVRISIYNLLGQEVKLLTNKFEAAGYRTIRWHGKDKFNQDVSAGIYFLLMETSNFTSTRKLILLK